MSAFTVTKRTTSRTQGWSSCSWCQADHDEGTHVASADAFFLDYRTESFQLCTRHGKEAREIWDGALDR